MNIRKIALLTLAVSALALLFATGLHAKGEKEEVTKTAETTAAQPGFPSEFESSKNWNKVADSLKQAYLDAKKAGFPEGKVLCFVRARDQLHEGDRAFLNSNGFVVQIISGRLARGFVELKNLPNITKLFFVQKISMGKDQ